MFLGVDAALAPTPRKPHGPAIAPPPHPILRLRTAIAAGPMSRGGAATNRRFRSVRRAVQPVGVTLLGCDADRCLRHSPTLPGWPVRPQWRLAEYPSATAWRVPRRPGCWPPVTRDGPQAGSHPAAANGRAVPRPCQAASVVRPPGGRQDPVARSAAVAPVAADGRLPGGRAIARPAFAAGRAASTTLPDFAGLPVRVGDRCDAAPAPRVIVRVVRHDCQCPDRPWRDSSIAVPALPKRESSVAKPRFGVWQPRCGSLDPPASGGWRRCRSGLVPPEPDRRSHRSTPAAWRVVRR